MEKFECLSGNGCDLGFDHVKCSSTRLSTLRRNSISLFTHDFVIEDNWPMRDLRNGDAGLEKFEWLSGNGDNPGFDHAKRSSAGIPAEIRLMQTA